METILTILGKVGFDWRMAVFNLVNFTVIYLILRHFAFGPIFKVIEERKKKIQEGIENFEKSKTEIGMAERKAQELIDEAKVSANKVLEQSHDEAKVQAEGMKKKARQEIELLVKQAKKNIEIDREEMQEQLKNETIGLVALATEKIIGEKIDDKKDESFIKQVIASAK